MLKPVVTTVDLDALTAYVVANPDDAQGWSCYSDYCRELGNDEWADLALTFRDADGIGQAFLIGGHRQSWPPACALATRSTSKFAEEMARAGRQLVEAFAAFEAGISRAMAPTIEALGRISRGEGTAGPPREPVTTD